MTIVSVFPTPVGMDRMLGMITPERICFPHTRGDGPIHIPRLVNEQPFSPHPWGWTVYITAKANATVMRYASMLHQEPQRSQNRVAIFHHLL